MRILLWLLFFVSLLSFACNEPSIIGEELLSDDRSEIFYEGGLRMKARTLSSDSVITWNASAPMSVHLCGNFTDPLMGSTRAQIFTQLSLSTLFPEFISSDNVKLKGVELLLAVDTFNSFGALDTRFKMQVSQLAEPMDASQTYYANQSFASNPPMAKHDFLPQWPDSIIPLVRMELPDALGAFLLSLDSITYTSNTLFQEAFKGLLIEAAKETNYMLAFNLNSGLSALRLSYVRNDTIDENYLFSFAGSTARMVHFEHDYSNTSVAPALAVQAPSDTVESLFVHGMLGVNTEFEFPPLDDLQGAIINKAELVCYSRLFNQADYPLFSQMLLSKYGENGNLEIIRDVSYTQGVNWSAFGGGVQLDPTLGVYVYKFNISAHLQDVIDGTEDSRMVLSPAAKPQRAGRVIFYGPGSQVFPVELKVTYTRRN